MMTRRSKEAWGTVMRTSLFARICGARVRAWTQGKSPALYGRRAGWGNRTSVGVVSRVRWRETLMMILRSSPASPFARKVRLAAAILGASDEIEIVAADTSNPDAQLLQQNPLGKIPALVLEDGRTLYDSAVILEYLDAGAGGGALIPSGEARFTTLTRQALADGLMDAAVLQVYE